MSRRRKGNSELILQAATRANLFLSRELTAKEWGQIGKAVNDFGLQQTLNSLSIVEKRIKDNAVDPKNWISYLFGVLRNQPIEDKEVVEKEISNILSDLL